MGKSGKPDNLGKQHNINQRGAGTPAAKTVNTTAPKSVSTTANRTAGPTTAAKSASGTASKPVGATTAKTAAAKTGSSGTTNSSASASARTSATAGAGTSTSLHRASRREQLEQARLQRQLEARRQAQRQRVTRLAALGGGVLAVVLLIVVIVHSVAGSSASASPAIVHGTGTYADDAATGQTRDNMPCYPTEQPAQHIHAYLAVYVNGAQVAVPGGTGIPGNGTCFYPLHVHTGQDNIIHVESPDNSTFTLGAFFDIWGQGLSSTRVMDNLATAAHPVTFYVSEEKAHGKFTKVTGDPRNIQLKAHETIVVLYNSPSITPTAYTSWNGL